MPDSRDTMAAPIEHDAFQTAVLTQAQRRDLITTQHQLDVAMARLRRAQNSLDAIACIEGATVSDDDLFRVSGALFGIADASIIAARSVRTVAAEITVGKTLED